MFYWLLLFILFLIIYENEKKIYFFKCNNNWNTIMEEGPILFIIVK